MENSLEELTEALDRLSEKVELQDITLKAIRDAADLLELKLDSTSKSWGNDID
jgi:hypothetical protein